MIKSLTMIAVTTLSMTANAALPQAGLQQEAAKSNGGKLVMVNPQTKEMCSVTLSETPKLQGAKQGSADELPNLSAGNAILENAGGLENIKECSGEQRQALAAEHQRMNSPSQTAAFPVVGVAIYYGVCTAINGAFLASNTAGEKGFIPFLVTGAISITVCGPVSGVNALLYYVGSSVLTNEEKN